MRQKGARNVDVNIFLFPNFETLDIFGPIEVLGRVAEYRLRYYSLEGQNIVSAQGTEIVTQPLHMANPKGIFVLPGGRGTRPLAVDKKFMQQLLPYVDACTYCLSICTGAAVLAAGGVLDGRRATSNKKAFVWVKSTGPKVKWEPRARWCRDGKFYTAAGVSAGIDMALGFVADCFGRACAETIARDMEYVWNDDMTKDIFAVPENK